MKRDNEMSTNEVVKTHEVVLSADDAEVISNLIGAGGLPSVSGAAGEALAESLEAATVVPANELPPTVVAMNCVVEYVELPEGKVRDVVLVHPSAADVSSGRISVLSPVGRALLGRKVGDACDVTVPGGSRLSITIAGVRPGGGHV
jgi:regulator of nucleoside diphosphate kinase